MVNIEVIYVIYLLLCATLGYFIAKHIGLKSENKELKERVSNEKKTMYDVWLRALLNNLPMIFDNQHGKETKGKKCPCDLYSINTEIKSFSASDLKPTEKDAALALQKHFFDLHKDALNGYINALKEKNKRQSTEFEAKEKKYVEKISQLEKEVLHQRNISQYFESQLSLIPKSNKKSK